jgi:hypothetical protein
MPDDDQARGFDESSELLLEEQTSSGGKYIIA